MKVAFTTSTGVAIDRNFLGAKSFTVWEIGAYEACYVHTVTIDEDATTKEERSAVRADALTDCAVLCTSQIGGLARAKLVARNIHPLKTGESTSVEEVIGKLQSVLRGTPPPWMRKAL